MYLSTIPSPRLPKKPTELQHHDHGTAHCQRSSPMYSALSVLKYSALNCSLMEGRKLTESVLCDCRGQGSAVGTSCKSSAFAFELVTLTFYFCLIQPQFRIFTQL